MDLGKFLPKITEGSLRKVACAAGVVLLGSAGLIYYRRWRRTNPPPELSQPATNDHEERLDETSDLQVDMPNWQLVATDPLPTEEAVIPHSGNCGLQSTSRIIRFLSTECHCSQSESVQLRRRFVCVVQGSEIQQWWFTIADTCRVNHLGFPYYTTSEVSFTGIHSISGTVTAFVSCRRLETFANVLLEDRVQTFHEVTRDCSQLWADGQEDAAHCVENSSFYTPYMDFESDSEGSDDGSLSPEESEVPFISCHLKDCGIADVALKLPALREAFFTLLTSVHLQNLLFVSGKELVMHLAALNNQDVLKVQLSYEALIRFLRGAANRSSIELEMLEIQLHLNFLDVLYELVVFGWFTFDSAPEFMDGGFLDQLFKHIMSWDPEIWETAAQQCFLALQDQLTEFLRVVFSQPLELYEDPKGLAHVVLELLKRHVQQMLQTTKKY
ncbi:uncharacterized protein LOC134305234 [Trichomycterus rosablanca]|uniref:uncharacterized protein LOC134304811 n=1 Tax=Trichomycterus rosablanca TaxID=2290929 RepID=UPI002F352DF8